jgi:site-specific DNA-methyltransferase (adenine-specific)
MTNFSRMQTQKHSYGDDPAKAREFMQFLLLESFRVCRERANLFMFCDIKHYAWLVDAASRAAWSPFPTPVVWDKMSPGVAPWQDSGFARSYELIFFATKGRRGLSTSIRDILQHKRVETGMRRSAAQKPDSLLRQLIAVATIPGEMVFDPCAGSGSTLLAAQALKRRALGFEIDQDLYNAALSAIHEEDLKSPQGTKT